MFDTNSRGSAAHTVPPYQSTLDEQLPIRLRTHMQRLRLILPVVSISVLALKQQDAELDGDIASVLMCHVMDPLDHELEQLTALLDSLVAQRCAKEEAV